MNAKSRSDRPASTTAGEFGFDAASPFTRLFWLASGICALLATTTEAQFSPGDILLSNLYGNNVEQYAPDGTLSQTFTGTGSQWEGAALTPDGNLVSTFRYPSSGIDIFNPSGAQIASFSTPQVALPGDISVFADGLLAVSDQWNPQVDLYSQSGTFRGSLTLSGASPFGNAVGPDNTLWVADPPNHRLYNVQEDGTVLHKLSLSFDPGDLVVDPRDNTLWVANRFGGQVAHMTAVGLPLSSFSVAETYGFDGIGQASDGSLYVAAESSNNIWHYSTSGTLLDSFAISNPGLANFMTVVVPEPATVSLMALGGLLLLWRCKGVAH